MRSAGIHLAQEFRHMNCADPIHFEAMQVFALTKLQNILYYYFCAGFHKRRVVMFFFFYDPDATRSSQKYGHKPSAWDAAGTQAPPDVVSFWNLGGVYLQDLEKCGPDVFSDIKMRPAMFLRCNCREMIVFHWKSVPEPRKHV